MGVFFNKPPEESLWDAAPKSAYVREITEKFAPGEQSKYSFSELEKNKNDLDDLFSGETWASLDLESKKAAVQALENRFAYEQNRPAKEVTLSDELRSTEYGGWDEGKDVIELNKNLLEYDRLSSDPRAGKMPDANMQVYDTIAHEGYHAYQTYALNNPWACADKQTLHEWALNSGRYFSPEESSERYLLQPQERDAWSYGHEKTMEAFRGIQERCGPESENTLAAYEAFNESNSYDAALSRARETEPMVLENMNREMEQYCYQRGIRTDFSSPRQEYGANTGQSLGYGPPGSYPLKAEHQRHVENPTFEVARQQQNPYAEDVGQYVQARTLGGSGMVYKPSLREQYLDGVAGYQNEFPNRYTDPQEAMGYQNALRSLMDDLGYYPELDPRAKEAYDSAMRDMYGENGEGLLAALNSGDQAQVEAAEKYIADYGNYICGEQGSYARYPEDYAPQEQDSQEETAGENQIETRSAAREPESEETNREDLPETTPDSAETEQAAEENTEEDAEAADATEEESTEPEEECAEEPSEDSTEAEQDAEENTEEDAEAADATEEESTEPEEESAEEPSEDSAETEQAAEENSEEDAETEDATEEAADQPEEESAEEPSEDSAETEQAAEENSEEDAETEDATEEESTQPEEESAEEPSEDSAETEQAAEENGEEDAETADPTEEAADQPGEENAEDNAESTSGQEQGDEAGEDQSELIPDEGPQENTGEDMSELVPEDGPQENAGEDVSEMIPEDGQQQNAGEDFSELVPEDGQQENAGENMSEMVPEDGPQENTGEDVSEMVPDDSPAESTAGSEASQSQDSGESAGEGAGSEVSNDVSM